MGVPTSEVGYTSATTRRGDHEVHKGHVVALAQHKNITCVLILRVVIPGKLLPSTISVHPAASNIKQLANNFKSIKQNDEKQA
jgi:hypothetical protein